MYCPSQSIAKVKSATICLKKKKKNAESTNQIAGDRTAGVRQIRHSSARLQKKPRKKEKAPSKVGAKHL